MSTLIALLVISAGAGGLSAQSMRIYTEFRRIDPFGNIVEPDQGGRIREVLSPALPRNGWTSFHVAVTVPPFVPFTVHVAQNPDGALELALYREVFERVGDRWIPDRLEPLPDLEDHHDGSPPAIPGQTTFVYWLDARVPAGFPVRRMRLEAQLYADGSWMIYPMEPRIVHSIVPESIEHGVDPLPPISDPVSWSTLAPWRSLLCSPRSEGPSRTAPGTPIGGGLTIRDRIRRNAAQDAALMKAHPRLWAIAQETGWRDSWCRPPKPVEGGPLWYQRIRDQILREPQPDLDDHR